MLSTRWGTFDGVMTGPEVSFSLTLSSHDVEDQPILVQSQERRNVSEIRPGSPQAVLAATMSCVVHHTGLINSSGI